MRNGKLEVLALGDRFSAAFKSIEHALLELGELSYRTDDSFPKAEDVVNAVRNSSFDLAIMPNPYGNPKRLWMYKHLRDCGFPVIVFDRGALPGSWFFDLGFNADSPTYHPLKWDTCLTDEQVTNVRNYIENVKNAQTSLESQGPVSSPDELKERLGISGKKVLFVGFQRPSDTTITYFSGPIGSYENFTKLVSEVNVLTQSLAPEWVVIAKKHPLEQQRPSARLLYVDDDENINSLINTADMVLVVNSGVGLLASLWNKPVLFAGDAFYSHVSLNRQIRTAQDVIYYMKNPFVPDAAIRDRFIHYLYSTVYSYGTFHTELVAQNDGSYRNITRNIEFQTLRFPSLLKKKDV